MADASPSSHRITVMDGETRYRFALSRHNRNVVCWKIPHRNGKRYWREMSQDDWQMLPAPVRVQVMRELLGMVVS